MSENEKSKDKSKKVKSIKDNLKSLPLKRNKPVRPQRLPSKTGYSHNVKLPTYEESQDRYQKFLCTSKKADEQHEQVIEETLMAIMFYLN